MTPDMEIEMGKFANTPRELGEEPDHNGLMEGAYLSEGQHRQPWHGESEFNAVGKEVPMFRRAAAERHLKGIGMDDAEKRFDIVNGMSIAIKNDNTHEALELCMRKGVDAIGCYRILAVLLSEPEPA